eukprot:TRINITY_DN10278_c0_g1_i1.p1 TRINITY_DN10278_c0_g1~~TRINITY_DN10278_c0_g1_i1.p1  ORF type:complete len:278 (-),score=59.25 TRINITY_DN10278_c0_g1_i1:46-879(-)
MACKVYAHLEVEGRPAYALPIDIARPGDTQFGSVKQALLQNFAERFPDENQPQYGDHCFWNQDNCPIADHASVAVYAWEHNDFFLRPLPEDAVEAKSGALKASRERRGELSYYYAHNRDRRPLIGKPQAVASGYPSAVAKAREPIKAVSVAAGAGYNSKQSPFGTDITKYESIDSYTWEDKDGDTVKVLVPLDGVGKLEPQQITAQFGVRAFELLIDGYNGKRLRFACYKTHGDMKPEECKHVVRANRVNLVLRKAKEKDIWFDLFKKRAIGDDDDP